MPIGIELPSHACGAVRVNKHQCEPLSFVCIQTQMLCIVYGALTALHILHIHRYVGCMNSTLSCYSARGKRQWTVPLPAPIVAMTLLSYRPRNLKAAVVAMQNGEVCANVVAVCRVRAT